jgi:hypothetical protein
MTAQGHRRILTVERCGHAVERALVDRLIRTSGPLLSVSRSRFGSELRSMFGRCSGVDPRVCDTRSVTTLPMG